jgi:nucleoside-diphosphate-sugar epimerase
MTRIFFTGATGYIGGTVLNKVLAYLNSSGKEATVRALVRTNAKRELTEKWSQTHGFTLQYVKGSLGDLDVVEEETGAADIVIDTADADAYEAQEAILRGLVKAIAAGKHPIYIHTSGTGLLVDNVNGAEASEKIYDDASDESIASIRDDAPHRNVDLLLLNWLDKYRGKADLVVIAPPTIWGPGSGPDNIWSIQVPKLIMSALEHKQAYQVGKGLNLWTQINVLDLGDFYTLILQRALAEPDKHSGFYFATGDEFAFGDVPKVIQRTLVDIGLATSTHTPSVSTKQDFDRIWPDTQWLANSVGSNSRARASKAKALGWQPKYSSNEAFFEDTRISTIVFARYPRL